MTTICAARPATSAALATLREVAPLGEVALAALAAAAVERGFAAGSFLLEAGHPAEWCFLLTRGLVREYYLATTGEEYTRAFVREGQLTGSLLDLLSGGPAVTWIEALEATTTLAFRYADFELLCRRHAELNLLGRRVAERLYVRKARREHDMLALTADARYARWLKHEPALDARISRRHLASYLGVTPEHLSRLRRARAPGA